MNKCESRNQLPSMHPLTTTHSSHSSHLPSLGPVLVHQSQVLVLSRAPEKAEMLELSKFSVGGEAAFVSTFRFSETINDYVDFPNYLIQQPYVFLSDATKRIFTT